MDQQNSNCCRICLANNNEEGFVKLFTEDKLSPAGNMFIELLKIDLICDDEMRGRFPQYLCNSCDLQLKLFSKLKMKAENTNKLLRDNYELVVDFEYVDSLDEMIKIEKLNATTVKNEDEPSNDKIIFLNICDSSNANTIELIENAIEKENSAIVDDSTNTSETFYINESQDSNDSPIVQYLDDYDDECCEIEKLEDQFDEMDDSLFKEERKEDGEEEEEEEENAKNSTESMIFACKLCSEVFSSKRLLTKHRQKVHAEYKRIKCEKCNKGMNSIESYEVHMNIHAGLPAYSCTMCEKTFNQKAHFKYHMANHLNERNVKCELCGKGFVTKSDLKIHMRMHTDERRYQCDVCGKDFRAYTHMKNHRYSHFEKKFECMFCSQKYISPSTLRTHVKSIHLGETPYQCAKCEKKFKRKHHLTNHMKTHRRNEFDIE